MTKFKGDNTGAFGQKWLRGRINLPDEIRYEKIAVQIGGLEPKIIETAEREFYINLTGEETAKLDYSNDVFCAIFDEHGQKKTLKGAWNFIVHREVVHEADAPDGTQPTTGILQNDVAFDWESEDYCVDFVLEYTPSKLSQLQDDIGVQETKEALANEIERSTSEDIAIRESVDELSTNVEGLSVNIDNLSTMIDDVADEVDTINSKIPESASSSNKLADKKFVIDKIQENSAHFRGNWATYDAIPTNPALYPVDDDGNHKPTIHDYLIVMEDETHGGGTWRYTYTGEWDVLGKSGWNAEYEIKDVPFTDRQWSAINSGATDEKIEQIADNATNIDNLNGRVTQNEADIQTLNSAKLEVSNLKQGRNITFDIDGNDITINSTGGGGGGASSFSELEGSPYDNTNLAQALNEKASQTDIETAVSNHNQDEESHSDIRADIDVLDKRIDEIQLYKVPNTIIIGEPTINNGQVSDFSQTNYMILPFLFDVQDRAFELSYCFRTGSNISTPQNLFGSKFSIASYVSNGKLVVRVSSNGTSWDIVDVETSLEVQTNTTYYVKLAYNRLNYTITASTDGETYSRIGYVVDTRPPFASDVYIGIGNNQNNPFLGIINLNKWELKYNNSIFWEGMDDAGLATRADISLSNLDAEGEARFDAKQDVIEDIDTIRDLAKGAQKGVSFTNYQSMVTNLNAYEYDKFIIGQSIYIATKDVPDVWVYAKYQESQQYTYTNDNAIVEALKAGTLRIGRFEISQLETGKVDIDGVIRGVQLNGTDLTPDTNSKVNIPTAATGRLGVVKPTGAGINVNSSGGISTVATTEAELIAKTNAYNVVTPSTIDKAVKVGITTNTLTLTDTEQRNAQTWLGTTDMEIEFSDGSESTFSIVGKM